MLNALVLAAAGFTHPTPQPPPQLSASVYQARREAVMKELGGCIAVLAATGETSGVTEDYRQDGDFLWLTGVNEPGAFSWNELETRDLDLVSGWKKRR